MAGVVVAPTAVADLDNLIRVLKLPADTRSRVRARLRQLADFLYAFEPASDQVSIVTIQDSRAAESATSLRKTREAE